MNAITTEIDTTSLPAIGVELNIDSNGASHIWRAVLAFPDDYTAATEHLVRMRHPGPYLFSPIHPLAGDLTEYESTPEEQADAISDALKERGYDTVVGPEVLAQNHFAELLEARGISVRGIEIDIPSDLHLDDPFGIGGAAGHEIAHLADFRAPMAQGPGGDRKRAFRIDVDGVTEFHAEREAILRSNTSWDSLRLDADHDVWVDVGKLSRKQPLLARIGGNERVPLPAYVLGAGGERSTDATLSLRELRARVRIDRRTNSTRPRKPEPEPALGFDYCFDLEGGRHPWRAVLAFYGNEPAAIEFLIRVPKGKYVTPTVHPVHGDLTELPCDAREQAEAISDAMRIEGHDWVDACWLDDGTQLEAHLKSLGIIKTAIMLVEPDMLGRTDDWGGVGGLAGHHLAHIFDNDLCNRGMEVWLAEQGQLKDETVTVEGAGQPPERFENQAA